MSVYVYVFVHYVHVQALRPCTREKSVWNFHSLQKHTVVTVLLDGLCHFPWPRVCRLYLHRITSTVISAAYLRHFRQRLCPCWWTYRCIAWKASWFLELMSSKCIGCLNGYLICFCCSEFRVQKHTVVNALGNHLCRSSALLSLFQPKTATIEDIAIALVKICLFAVWRLTKRYLRCSVPRKGFSETHGGHWLRGRVQEGRIGEHHSVHFITHQSFAFY